LTGLLARLHSQAVIKETHVKTRITFVLIMLMIVIGIVSAANAEEKRLLLSLGGGVFKPQYDASEYDQGKNFTLSLSYWPTDALLGAGIDLNRNKVEFGQTVLNKSHTSEIETTSIECLIYIQPNIWKIQPYIGFGVGKYENTVINTWGDAILFDDNNQSGFGLVAKGGIRAFLGDRFFIGAYGKYFTNEHNVSYTASDGNTLNLKYRIGGTTVNAEIGVRF
jgi:outer membrane protein W